MDYQSLDLSDHSQVYNYLTSLNLVLSNPQDQIEFQVQLELMLGGHDGFCFEF